MIASRRISPLGPNKTVFCQGLAVSGGIAIGVAQVREIGAIEAPEYVVAKSNIAKELKRLDHAVILTRRQVRRLQNRVDALDGEVAKELGFLLDAYQMMLKDSRLVRGAGIKIVNLRINAEAAIQREITEISSAFQSMTDSYIAARLDDIRDVGNRIIRNLTRKPIKRFSSAPKGSIIIAKQLTPADMAQIDPERIAGVASVLGGAEGHTAIMARALGIPMVLGIENLLTNVKNGETVIVDGSAGEVLINPDKTKLEQYRRRRDTIQRKNRQLARLRQLPALSIDGTQFQLMANVELPMELPTVLQAGAEGIGLLRSEFMFMNRNSPPDEEEQYQHLCKFIKDMNGQQVTFRSLDIGADKSHQGTIGELDDSAASALGLRGIRLALLNEGLLETQFRAVLRAAAHGPVRILLPMISAVGEVHKAKKILGKAARKLKRRKIAIPEPLPPLGVMIEVPGAALAADALAQVSDFFAIGSNDLTMYTLAADRANEHVAHLYDPLHPAVLRLIQFATNAALRARIPISICGEMAGDSRFTALLIGLGLHELSMTPASIPHVKQRIRNMDAAAAAARAALIMDQKDSGRIAVLLDDFNNLA